jgi:hypothetical protein
MSFVTPNVSDFKAYFVRDFQYGDGVNLVSDSDITKAFTDTVINFNQDLFSDQASFNVGFLNLAAHFMVMSIRASSQGLVGQYSWVESSKSVGSVSESLSIPQRILDNPEFAMLSKTNYGAKYLFLILPQLTGQIFSSYGGTNA